MEKIRIMTLIVFFVVYNIYDLYSQNQDNVGGNIRDKIKSEVIKPLSFSIGSSFDFIDKIDPNSLYTDLMYFNDSIINDDELLFKFGLDFGLTNGKYSSIKFSRKDDVEYTIQTKKDTILKDSVITGIQELTSILSNKSFNFHFAPLISINNEIVNSLGIWYSPYLELRQFNRNINLDVSSSSAIISPININFSIPTNQYFLGLIGFTFLKKYNLGRNVSFNIKLSYYYGWMKNRINEGVSIESQSARYTKISGSDIPLAKNSSGFDPLHLTKFVIEEDKIGIKIGGEIRVFSPSYTELYLYFAKSFYIDKIGSFLGAK